MAGSRTKKTGSRSSARLAGRNSASPPGSSDSSVSSFETEERPITVPSGAPSSPKAFSRHLGPLLRAASERLGGSASSEAPQLSPIHHHSERTPGVSDNSQPHEQRIIPNSTPARLNRSESFGSRSPSPPIFHTGGNSPLQQLDPPGEDTLSWLSLDHRSDLFYFGVKSRLVCSSLFRFGFNSSPKLRTLLRPESDYEKTRVAISC